MVKIGDSGALQTNGKNCPAPLEFAAGRGGPGPSPPQCRRVVSSHTRPGWSSAGGDPGNCQAYPLLQSPMGTYQGSRCIRVEGSSWPPTTPITLPPSSHPPFPGVAPPRILLPTSTPRGRGCPARGHAGQWCHENSMLGLELQHPCCVCSSSKKTLSPFLLPGAAAPLLLL